ncbi:hypothetical protein [Sporosarcina psychrophila]|uniref:Gram-positive cocci surface proteins LPxTG domain-containing protein n=1 Tax=Sporosarcina psychrophila TaxID=1476 RepID=A0ABV2K3L4_SPOPS
MKNNWMKYTGVTLGMCLTLSFSPSFVNADEPGEDNSLNLDINLLNDKEDKATIVDIQADNVPILGDLKAQIPAKSPVSANTSDVGEDNQQKSALATIELTNTDGLIDDLNVSVMEQSSMQDENSASSKSSLASVNLSTPITNEVELDVLLSDAQSGDETSSYDGGLVELNAEDLPVLGEVHAGVLDSHYKNAEESTSLSSGLLQANLDDGLLDETSVDVLSVDKSMNEESSQQSTALASVKADDDSLGGLIDDLNVSVMERSSMQDENSAASKSSLASVNLSTPITNEVELDVLLSDAQSGEETSSYDGGLVELNAEDLPVLGEVHAGVLDSHYKNAEETTSLSSGLLQADLDDGLLDETSVDVLTLDRNTDGNMTSTKHSGVSLIVGNDTIGNINVDILTNETMQPGLTEGDTVLTPPIDDATGLTPDEGGDVATPNEETVSPPKTEDVTGLKPGSDAGGVSPNVNIEEQTPSTVTEEITLNENTEGVSDDTVGITHSEDSASSASEEETDGIVWAATDSNAMSEAIAMDTIGMKQNPPSSNGMGQVLPKTGGFFDSIILSLLALFLLATGLGIRRFAH